MARKRKKTEIHPGELNLTAMIDVAFQLLSFFIITVHPVDVLAHLDVFRPSAEQSANKSATPPKMIKVMVMPGGFSINDRPVALPDPPMGKVYQQMLDISSRSMTSQTLVQQVLLLQQTLLQNRPI